MDNTRPRTLFRRAILLALLALPLWCNAQIHNNNEGGSGQQTIHLIHFVGR